MARDLPDNWNHLRRRVYRRDSWQCQCCGRRGNEGGSAQLHAHHILERSSGGTNDLDNLITLCDRCHAAYHDNPHLLEDGPPVTPSVVTRLKDWAFIDVLGISGEDARTRHCEEPEESEWREEWREQGLIALEQMSRRRAEPDGFLSRLFGAGDGGPPRLYTVGSGGILFGTSDEALNDQFGGCPRCGDEGLTADWISWKRRRSAKRVRCESCDTLFQERIVERNGRKLVDLKPVSTVFAIETVGSRWGYQRKRPNRSLFEFERRYGVDCAACGGTESLHYELGWRRSDLLPRRTWVCEDCESEFVEEDGQYSRVSGEWDDNSAASALWYYLIVGTVLLGSITLFVDPLLVPVVGILAAPAVYRDIEYVRLRSDRNPSRRLWVWTTIALGMLGASIYLLGRKWTDSTDSDLHSQQLQRAVVGVVTD